LLCGVTVIPLLTDEPRDADGSAATTDLARHERAHQIESHSHS